jgi:hypothetical protein
MANEPSQNSTTTTHFRMETGLDVLEDWAEAASQHEKNAVYKALFAMQDGSLFRTYRVIDDIQRAGELFVIVRDDLVMRLRVNRVDSFSVVAIGPCGHAAGTRTERRHVT